VHSQAAIPRIQEIKIGGGYDYEVSRYAESLLQENKAEYCYVAISDAVIFLRLCLQTFTQLMVTWRLARGVCQGERDYRNLITLSTGLKSLQEHQDSFAACYRGTQSSKVKSECTMDLLNIPVDRALNASEQKALDMPGLPGLGLAFEKVVSEAMPQELTVNVPRGQFVAIVGSSGSGKTSLVELMTSLKRPSRGIYRINGREAQRIPDDIRTRDIHLVRQGAPLTEGTVMEIIKWPKSRDVPDSWVHKVCDVVQIHEKISQLPQGYQSVIGERSRLLSSGERQRIALARALAHRPRLLVMDEATSQLDSATTRQVLEGIRILLGGTTIVMVTHQMFAVENVDRIIVMHERRVVETGKHEALMRIQGGEYKNLWDNQEPRSCHAGRDIA